jgi:predicted transcriptional regulator of viral defense system
MPRRPGATVRADAELPDVALARDFSRDVVARRVRSGDWQRIGCGIYLPAGRSGPDLDGVTTARVAGLAHAVGVHHRLGTDHWFSHETAAAIWGLPTIGVPATTHLVQRHAPGSRSDPRITRHVMAVQPEDVTEHRGLPVTTLERTAVDCARSLPPLGGLAVVDAALAKGVDREVLLQSLVTLRGRPGARRARVVIELADAGAESAGETFVRYLVLRDGLPRPTTQIPVETRLGTRWGDVGWEVWRLLLEYDGRVKYTDREALVREKRRHDAVVEAGYRLLRVSKEDLRGRPLTDRVLAALRPDDRPRLRPRRDLRI